MNNSIFNNGNQLVKVTDGCDALFYAGAMDFKDGSDAQTEYSWDANGNMTKDLNKGITRIGYNELNLPSSISYSDGHSVRYTYAADGRKLRVDYLVAVVGTLPGRGPGDHNLDPPPHPGGDWNPLDPDRVLLRLDYCGNHVYRNGSLERTTNDYGYLADSTYYYYIKDYQGNVRAVINQAGALKEINNYYPYGGLMGAATAGVQPHKYGGKELDRENGLDWLDFGARQQDPMLPIFTTQDPLAEKTPRISPYAYCAGNPIRYIDPNGEDAIISIEDNVITISVNIILTGKAANNDLANAYRQNILDTWGQFTTYVSEQGQEYDLKWDINISVDQNILDPDKLFDGKNNYMEVVPGFIRSFVNNTNDGKITSDFRQGNPMAHEFGHMLGLVDRYHVSSSKKEKQDGVTHADKGWAGNIMASRPDAAKVQERNFESVFSQLNALEKFQKSQGTIFPNPFHKFSFKYKINSTNREKK